MQQRLATLLGQDDGDRIEQLRRRPGQLAIGLEDGAALELGAPDLRRNQKGNATVLLDCVCTALISAPSEPSA
jgi:hypothetical protein